MDKRRNFKLLCLYTEREVNSSSGIKKRQTRNLQQNVRMYQKQDKFPMQVPQSEAHD